MTIPAKYTVYAVAQVPKLMQAHAVRHVSELGTLELGRQVPRSSRGQGTGRQPRRALVLLPAVSLPAWLRETG